MYNVISKMVPQSFENDLKWYKTEPLPGVFNMTATKSDESHN